MINRKQGLMGLLIAILIILSNILGINTVYGKNRNITNDKLDKQKYLQDNYRLDQNNIEEGEEYTKNIGGRVLYKDVENIEDLEDLIKSQNDLYYIVKDNKAYGYNKTTSDTEIIDLGMYKDKIEGKIHLPVDEVYFKVSSNFGIRKHPVVNSLNQNIDSGVLPFHAGLDISAAGIRGANIYSVLDGKVSDIKIGSYGYGNLVIIDHDGILTYYAHMKDVNEELEVGDEIKAGDLLGYVGSTGNSTGPHLHIEFQFGDVVINPLLLLSPESRLSLENIELETQEVENKTKDEVENMTEEELKEELGMEILDESQVIKVENIISSSERLVDTGVIFNRNQEVEGYKSFKIDNRRDSDIPTRSDETGRREEYNTNNIKLGYNRKLDLGWKLIPIDK